MVFESLVTDVLNRVLGDYVENLDSKQLKIGIWGGDVVLTNLILKQSALNDLDLPVQAVYGCLSKLTLKIPWKNLYYSSVEATVEGLYLLVEPNLQVHYDQEKEERKAFEAKQAILSKIEEAKKKELESNKKVDDTLVEKLTTQIIRNVQITIKDIHIRYEDKVTTPEHPFTMGITLSELIVRTTDSEWVPAIVYDDKSTVKIHKIVSLEGLAVYWNCNSVLYNTLPFADLINRLKTEIPTKTFRPANYDYILGPITSSARLKLNPKPEYDKPSFSIPKAVANLEMEKLSVGITKLQYKDIVAFADSMDLMSKGVPYRAYRPNVPSYRGYYKEWWHFAYTCILETEVRRIKRNWNWNYLLKHRKLCKEYGKAYQIKLQSKTCPQTVLDEITGMEKQLNVMNIVLIRQKAELELERLGKHQQKNRSNKTWFSSWWSGAAAEDEVALKASGHIVSQFQAAMTPEEKDRLYHAIDYQENAVPIVYPKSYVDTSCVFVLKLLEIKVTEDEVEVLNAKLESVKCKVDTRTAANGMAVYVNVDTFMVFGITQDEYTPELISSQSTGENLYLLDVTFETNPLDSIYGQKIYLTANPLKIVYDAVTINKMIDVFKVPQSSALAQLSEATTNTLSDVKTKSTAGIQYLIDEHILMDVKLDLHAPYLIIPYGGIYTQTENLIVANLGHVTITSTDRSKTTIKQKHLAGGTSPDEIFKALVAESYDKFIIELTAVQVLLVPGGELWMDKMKKGETSNLHLLDPISLHLKFHKCLIDNDPRLPQSKITGVLPSISIKISDQQLLLLTSLMNSITFPKNDEELVTFKDSEVPVSRSQVMEKYMDKATSTTKSLIQGVDKEHKEKAQYILLQVNFLMQNLSLTLNHQEYATSPFENVAVFSISGLECDFQNRTFVNHVTVRLAFISLYKYHNGNQIEIISTPICSMKNHYLFTVNYLQVDKKCPEFKSKYNRCESLLTLEFALVKIVLHQEVLEELVKYANDLQVQLEEIQSNATVGRESRNSLKRTLSSISDTIAHSTLSVKQKHSKAMSADKCVIETILFKVEAKLTELVINFANDACEISSFSIKDLHLEIIMKKPYTQIKAILRDLVILDCNTKSLYSKILSVVDEEAVNLQIVMYNTDYTAYSITQEDIKLVASFGCLHIIFLNLYISTMLNFVDKFQAARTAIVEASAAAADKAKHNVTDIYENATKIALNIHLRAPKIVIPRSSQDYNALFADLGNLQVINKLLMLEIKNENEEPAIIDEMQLKLAEFKLCRIRTDEKHSITNDITILQPVSFSLNVKRNLSSKWYQALPDIHVVGQIENIVINIGQPDYQMIMATLTDNFEEANRAMPSESVKPISNNKSPTIMVAATDSALIIHEQTEKASTTEEKDVHIFLKFNFMMNSFIIALFTLEDGSNDKFTFNSNRQGLAMFSLEGLSIKGRILTDDTINTSILLVDCILEDIRPTKKDKLNRLLSRKMFGETECISRSISPFSFKTMLDVTFKQKENDIYLDVRVSGFDLILSMDFLSKVQAFFMSALISVEEDEEEEEAPRLQTRHKMKAAASVPSNKIARTEEPVERNISFNLQIEKPDIVLVETMSSIDTNCLILNCELLMKIRIDGKHQVISGIIKDIQMYTCVYNPEKRANTMGNVIYPFTINIAGSTPEGHGLHIEVCFTKVHLRISPNIIELLNRAYLTMYGVNKEALTEDETFGDFSQLWDYKTYREKEFWFLRTECAEEAYDILNLRESHAFQKLNELCIFRLPSLQLTVEAGVGNKTLPMLLLESHFNGKIKDWSSNMVIDAVLTLQMGYYNSTLAVWEPLIEPIGEQKENSTVYNPWELKIDVIMNNPDDTTSLSPSSEGEFQEVVSAQPKMSIEFSSTANLEITVTKAALEVLSNLGDAFAEAVSTDTQKYETDGAPYKLINESGLSVKILLEGSSFQVYGNRTPNEIVLENGTEIDLELKPDVEKYELQLNAPATLSHRCLNVKMVELNSEIILNIIRADTRYFSLKYRGENNNYWGIISSTKIESGVIVVTLSSIVKVHNHFNIPIDIYYMTPRGNELQFIGSIKPGVLFNVPIKAIYTPTNELFFSVSNYSVTSNPFIWKDLQSNVNQIQVLQAFPKENLLEHNEPFVIKVMGEIEQVYHESTLKHTMTSILCNVHLHPAVRFRNCLPVDISMTVQNINVETKIEPGDTLIVPNVNPGSSYVIVRLLNYLDREWSCIKDIPINPTEFSVWTFDSFQGTKKMSIDLGLHVLDENGAHLLSLYCPFWMLNKSELNLSYRSSDENLNILHHPANYKNLILFSFNAKNFFGKKKASVRISNGGEWSDKFPIDVAGSSGVVTCKYQGKIYQLGVHIQLNYNGLTKQVTFTPYYVMINGTHFAIECQEFERPADPWRLVEPNSCAALWPAGDRDDKLLKLRVVGTEEISPSFFISESHTTLLKLKNKYGGIHVDVQITEGAIYIFFGCYEKGLAPALIINNTRNTLNIWEKDTVQLRKLDPGCKFYYTWENPAGVRVLVWEAGYKKEIQDDLRKDGGGEYAIAENNYVYWVSFLDGMQRILLFTCNQTVAENAQQAKSFDEIDQEVTLSIHGLGLSLVNNIDKKEIMYIMIANSGIIWETCKPHTHRFKQMNTKESTNMEAAYQQYLMRKEMSDENIGRTVIDAKTEVDFDLNEMYKPYFKKIRRTFLTGLWFQMSTNAVMMQLHAKINRLQIDNQMFNCLFPVVLAPVPPPKTVANTDVHKPFAELSIVQLLMKHSQIKQYKYFKILIQEFHMKLDLAFVTAVMNVFPQVNQLDLEAEKKKFLIDTKLVNNPLYLHVSLQYEQEQKSFYDLLHFSPLKIHVSFSMAGSDSSQGVSTPNILNVLLQGLGVTLTDMQDVVFKLAYFDREYTFLTQKQLVGEASGHYIGQAVKQLYVLVLGLDVLGNPYGLVLGITKGVEDLFYEPFQGAIQGPGEFAEGLVLGVRSLFGHTVGGAAGAVSRIAGAMGKGLAALTFDKEFQRKRRDQLSKKPATVQEGIARSGRGLVMGVYDGITGVVKKPISGAKEEGVGGFIKGLGKGAVGLVTRPTAGVIDFASSSLDTVKRVTEFGGEDAQRLRTSRFIQVDGIVRPYNSQEAEGYKLLYEMDKGKYANTDIYVYHFNVIFRKEVLLITDKRIAYISHNDLFGGWQLNWAYTWQEIVMPPKIVPKGIAITLSESKKRRSSTLFSTTDSGKTILINDRKICEEICLKITELYKSV